MLSRSHPDGAGSIGAHLLVGSAAPEVSSEGSQERRGVARVLDVCAPDVRAAALGQTTDAAGVSMRGELLAWHSLGSDVERDRAQARKRGAR